MGKKDKAVDGINSTAGKNNKNLSGSEKFDLYYSEIYGSRWPTLKEALLCESKPISLSDNLASPYYMDKASILAASILPITENNKVLDMCAAPGGKTLVLAMKLNGTGKLVANDRSAQRRTRLAKVINCCLSENLRQNITITGHDSTTCSSERHVLTDPSALSIWSPSRPKHLAIQQFAMLAAALDAAVDGGYILYSTCSINPVENELVIEKLCKKRSGLFEEVSIEKNTPKVASVSEKRPHGRIILPDSYNSCGPLYFCLLKKLGKSI